MFIVDLTRKKVHEGLMTRGLWLTDLDRTSDSRNKDLRISRCCLPDQDLSQDYLGIIYLFFCNSVVSLTNV